jgi:phytoene desaturase
MDKKIIVIGAGFSGLSAAATLAKNGFEVEVIERHDMPGGRARKFSAQGFTFDMGPSWYWMPDVFEQYFGYFEKSTSDYYKLERLDPSYTIYFDINERVDIPADLQQLIQLFERIEQGSGTKLKKFLDEAAYKYDIGINRLVHKPAKSLTEYLEWDIIKGVFRMHLFQSFSAYIRKYFKDPRLIRALEFPVIFLGATAEKIPALYSLMNYGDIVLGTWYPKNGMYSVVQGFEQLAIEQGVTFSYNEEVLSLEVDFGKISRIETNKRSLKADYVIASADYHHVEQKLLPPAYRRYDEQYWNKRVMSPSSLIYYLGINKKLDNILHHTLIFNPEFDQHARDIYETPRWPAKPAVYLSCTSKTDPTVAPEGMENLFVLIPVAPGLDDTDEIRQHYFDFSIKRIEEVTGNSFKDDIIYKRFYSNRDFSADYNAYKGNAYGLANTLMQTAFLKPSMFNKKVNNLLYTGQLTTPGPGVPPTIISGQVAAKEIIKRHKK